MIATNDIFRGPFSSGRPAVPMTGYYEQVETDGGGKFPCFMHHPAGELLCAASLTAARKSDDGEDWDVTFMIVTRQVRRRSEALCACIGLWLSLLHAEAYGRARRSVSSTFRITMMTVLASGTSVGVDVCAPLASSLSVTYGPRMGFLVLIIAGAGLLIGDGYILLRQASCRRHDRDAHDGSDA